MSKELNQHLSADVLAGLADGELPVEQLAEAQRHLAHCQACTSDALAQSLLKAATARAGDRYTPSARLLSSLAWDASHAPVVASHPVVHAKATKTYRAAWSGWAAAAVLLVASVSVLVVQRNGQQAGVATESASLATEVTDQHIAVLAANQPPEVISSDRHTVKPWFQGRIPFSFNLPEKLPPDTTLEGANLAYLHGHAVAQLLFSLGKHRVSVFVQEKVANAAPEPSLEHAGFHVRSGSTDELNLVMVSDADPARLAELLTILENVQAKNTSSHP